MVDRVARWCATTRIEIQIRECAGASHGETTARAYTPTKNRGSWYWSKHHPLHSRPNYTSQLALSSIFSPSFVHRLLQKKKKKKNGNNAYAYDYPSRWQNLLLLLAHVFLFFFFYLRSFSPLSGCSSFPLECSFIWTIFVSVCLFEIRSPSSFFVYFPFSPPSIFVCRYNPRLCSSFFALLFFLFVPLALSLFLTSEQNRCFEPWTFFSPALLAQLYMPLILFKLQSFPLSFFSISLYTISLTESTLFSFSITSRLALVSRIFHPFAAQSSRTADAPQFKLFVWPVNVDLLSFSLSHSFTHSLIITRIYRPKRESLPFAQIFVLSIFVSPPPPLFIPLSLPPRVRAFCIAAGALSASLGCSKVNLY